MIGYGLKKKDIEKVRKKKMKKKTHILRVLKMKFRHNLY